MAELYNGWANYETWNVALWMGEDGNYWAEIAQEVWDDAEADRSFTREERATLTLSDRLKDSHEENTPSVTGVYADLLNAALSEVNWYEIAEHYIADVDKEEEDEGD